jgi:hypothetical protein
MEEEEFYHDSPCLVLFPDSVFNFLDTFKLLIAKAVL